MKKLIKRIAVLLITSAVGYVVFILVILALHINNWFPGNEILTGAGFTLKKTKEIKSYSDVDVLFLGSSNVLRGVDTRVFEANGIKAFNLGTYSQSAYNSYFLLKEYSPIIKPKCVVLDLYWPVVSGDGSESTVDIVSNHDLTYNIMEMAVATHNMLTIRNLIAVSLSRLRKPLYLAHVKDDYKCEYIPGGFASTTYIDVKKKNQQFANVDTQIKLPINMQLEYLNKCISLCKASNIKLMIILVPVSKRLKDSMKNYKDYSHTIAAVAEKTNTPFIDYNEKDDLNLSTDSDYSDKNHMDTYGAEKFTKRLFIDVNNFWHNKSSISAAFK